MKLEAGKRYITRDAKVTGPLEINCDGTFYGHLAYDARIIAEAIGE